MHGLTTYKATYEGAEYVKEAKIFLIHPQSNIRRHSAVLKRHVFVPKIGESTFF